MGKDAFYALAARELREAGCEHVFEELQGELKGSRGVRPADVVAIIGGAVVVTEIKSPKEAGMLPMGALCGLRNDYLIAARRAVARQVKEGGLPRAVASHVLFLAQAEHYAQTFVAREWSLKWPEKMAHAEAGLHVGYCVPLEHEDHVLRALEYRGIWHYLPIRRAVSFTTVYLFSASWQPTHVQLPLF